MTDIYLKAHNNRVIVSEFNPKFEAAYKPRTRVSGFTYFAKARLSMLLTSFKEFPFVSFWALTFAPADFKKLPKEFHSRYNPDGTPTAKFAKAELKRFCMVLNRKGIGWLWVMEYQERGAIHFHFLLTEFKSARWVQEHWRNGNVKATKVWHEVGLRKYILKEISKNNQKRSTDFAGRWWGVSRFLNKKYSLGLIDEHCFQELVETNGVKRCYWREDFDKIGIDLTYHE